MSEDGPIRGNLARVFIDGEEVVGAIDSLRWRGDQLVSEQPVKITAPRSVPLLAAAVCLPPDPARVPEGTERSGSFTVTFPRASLWTRLYCGLWWGHRPVRHTLFGFITDELTCRCGKVTDKAERVHHLTAR